MDKRTLTFAVIALSLVTSLAEAKHKPRDRDRGGNDERIVRCESVADKHTYCQTNTVGVVEVAKQLSRTQCERYDTWGADGDGSGIWVRNGCRADFIVRERRAWNGWRARDHDRDGDRDESLKLRCASKEWGYEHCAVRGGSQNVRIARQISETRCIEGDNWGKDRRGIWVDRGCEAVFDVR